MNQSVEALNNVPNLSTANFLNLVSEVETRFIQQGLAAKTTPQSTIDLFANLTEEQRALAIYDLRSTLAALIELESSSPSAPHDGFQLSRFLFERRLRMRDDRFPSLIDQGDIVEVYDSRAVQIYRNFAYFKYCPYSLTELLVNDWNTLFQRPTWVIDRLMKIMPALFEKNASTYEYDLPEYLVSARLHRQAKGMLYKMKYATPLVDQSGATVAFVTTGTVRFVPDLKVGLQVDFL